MSSPQLPAQDHARKNGARWFVLGVGSIGCLYAAHMQRAGIETTLLLRDATICAQLEGAGGITLETDGQSQLIAIDAVPLSAGDRIGQLLICTKAQQTGDAVRALLPQLRADVVIVLLQNGMGVREEIQAQLPQARIVNALSTEGAWRRERFTVVHAGHGETLIGGSESALVTTIASDLGRSGLTVRAVDDIETRLWHKLAINCVINPLTALRGCRNGDLLSMADIDMQVAAICAEITAVAATVGTRLDCDALQHNIIAVMRSTANNRSSMLQDMDHRRRTEIDYLNGYVARLAQTNGVAAFHNEKLLRAIKTREAQLSCN